MKGKLKDVFTIISNLPWDSDLYVENGDLALDSNVVVAAENNTSDHVDGFRYYLTIQEVQDVVENLEQQTGDLSFEMILKAVEHYFVNDSYINIRDY